MNNENNNLNNGQNMPTTPTVPNTESVANKFMQVDSTNQFNQPVNNVVPTPVNTQPVQSQVVVPTTQPEIMEPVPQTQVVEMPTQPQVMGTTPQPQVDNNAMVNENLQKVEIKNYTPPSKFKIFMLFVFFALLVAFIMFLPDISSMVRIYLNGGSEEPSKPTITNGKLICDLATNTTDLDKEYSFEFGFTDNKVKTIKYIVYTRGDTTTEAELDELAARCKKLTEYTEDVGGTTVKCEYTENKLMEKQVFELDKIDMEKYNAEYTEMGGMIPSYRYDQDMDGIEKNMKASGYSCERTS